MKHRKKPYPQVLCANIVTKKEKRNQITAGITPGPLIVEGDLVMVGTGKDKFLAIAKKKDKE